VSVVDPEFAAFVRAVQGPLERVARRLAPAGTDPYDIAAEALARAYGRWDSLGEITNKQAWVLRVATNLAFSARRNDTRRARILRSRRIEVSDGRFEDSVADRDRLRSALVALPRGQRMAIALRYLADLPLAEVARAMGISTETAKTHLDRGRAALRATLGADVEKAIEDPR
jgi:RNA polymerase sigma-70 factor (ECF subfamily)